jgi:hypothetical protein
MLPEGFGKSRKKKKGEEEEESIHLSGTRTPDLLPCST